MQPPIYYVTATVKHSKYNYTADNVITVKWVEMFGKESEPHNVQLMIIIAVTLERVIFYIFICQHKLIYPT